MRTRTAIALTLLVIAGSIALLAPGPRAVSTLDISISLSGTVTLTFSSTYFDYDPLDFHSFELHRSPTRNGTYSEVGSTLVQSNTATFSGQSRGYWYRGRAWTAITGWTSSDNIEFPLLPTPTRTPTPTPTPTPAPTNSPPEFGSSSYSREVPEDASIGDAVDGGGAVTATDDDGDTVSYSISGSKFFMDSSGTIKVAGVLDHETTDSYSLTATARDGSLAGTATVNITVLDVNENPRFAQSTYPLTVREGSFSVGTVSASDPEGGSVTYSITAGDDDSIFSIGSSNGIIGVATLDYETASSYSLTVTASDITGKTGMATVNITVEDLNEVSITGPAAAVTEGEDMTFTVSVENTTASALVVSYTLGGTAAFSTDYDYDSTHSCTQSGTTHCVTIPANSTSASIRFDTVPDTLTEAHETVVVRLISVSGGTDVGLDTAPSKRVATGEIVSPIEVPALDDNASSTVSVAVANGNTSTLRFDLSDLDAGRAYVVRMTALGRTAGSRDPVGEVALDAGATPALPGFADIGGGQFVWVEGSSAPSPNERSVVVSFPREPTASSLEVTVSKPDLAFIGKPTAFVPMWGDTTGTVRLSMNIRNSSSTPSVDAESEIVVSCDTERSRYHSTRTHSFSSLREWGTSLIGAEASEMVAIGSVCQGVALSSGTSEATADSFSFVVGVVVGDEVLHEVRLPHPDADYRWPFAVTDTLWHPQGTTTGGLQMIVMRPASIGTCTLREVQNS